MTSPLPTDAKARKDTPIVSGCLDYFPAALAEVARLSRAANEQHNPGEPMHWARDKSGDHAECLIRHLIDRGTLDTDGQRHSAKVAWRALALLQTELEAEGAPMARGAWALAEECTAEHVAPKPQESIFKKPTNLPACCEERPEIWHACEERFATRCERPGGPSVLCRSGHQEDK